MCIYININKRIKKNKGNKDKESFSDIIIINTPLINNK